jgi:hypothetical protein
MQLLCLHKQMCLTSFGERSDRGKPKVLRGSARKLVEQGKPKVLRGSAQKENIM